MAKLLPTTHAGQNTVHPQLRRTLTLAQPRRRSFSQVLSGAMEASVADKTVSLNRPVSFALHRGASLLVSAIPFAGLVFDNITLGRIVQQFDPKYEFMDSRVDKRAKMDEKAQKAALLEHVKDKILSQNAGEQQQGMAMLLSMQTHARRVLRQAQHPKSSEARRFVEKMQMAQKTTTAEEVLRKNENTRNVQMNRYLSEHRNGPAHLVNKYRRPGY